MKISGSTYMSEEKKEKHIIGYTFTQLYDTLQGQERANIQYKVKEPEYAEENMAIERESERA